MKKVSELSVLSGEIQIAEDVEIAPYVVIEGKVKIGKGTKIMSGAYITGNVEIGEDNVIYPHVVIGTEPQDLSYKGEDTFVKIGNRNIIREYTSIHRGTAHGIGKTVIGDDNYFMAYSHIAHDCIVGNHTIFTNTGSLAGHVEVEDYAIIGAFSGVHQFSRVGMYSFMGGSTVATQDVPPFSKIVGQRPALIVGVNTLGLKRAGFSKDEIEAIREAFDIFFYRGLSTKEALKELEKTFPDNKHISHFIDFVKKSKRGVIKKTLLQWRKER